MKKGKNISWSFLMCHTGFVNLKSLKPDINPLCIAPLCLVLLFFICLIIHHDPDYFIRCQLVDSREISLSVWISVLWWTKHRDLGNISVMHTRWQLVSLMYTTCMWICAIYVCICVCVCSCCRGQRWISELSHVSVSAEWNPRKPTLFPRFPGRIRAPKWHSVNVCVLSVDWQQVSDGDGG